MSERLNYPIIEPRDLTPILDPFVNHATIGDMPFKGYALELAYTPRERLSIIERDNNKCQFPEWHRCGGGLQVHHIIPQRYAEAIGMEEWDYAENGITLCKNSHLKQVHPDMGQALANYGRDPDGINRVFTERELKLQNKETYWNTKWDRQFNVIAQRNGQKARKNGWEFPSPKEY